MEKQMFGKKKRDLEPEIPEGHIRDAETGEIRLKFPYEMTWQELGYPSEAAYRQSIEDMRVKLARATQRHEQHANNREVWYRLGLVD
jgi:hypothetical protein